MHYAIKKLHFTKPTAGGELESRNLVSHPRPRPLSVSKLTAGPGKKIYYKRNRMPQNTCTQSCNQKKRRV